jgi:hypothetical protein
MNKNKHTKVQNITKLKNINLRKITFATKKKKRRNKVASNKIDFAATKISAAPPRLRSRTQKGEIQRSIYRRLQKLTVKKHCS